MTTPTIAKLGLVHDFSEQGQWALSAALKLARLRRSALNVYYFLESPFDVPLDVAPADLPVRHYDSATLVQKERELREYFEGQLGDFEEVRFRICETGRHNKELRRCLIDHEYQLLIIPHLRNNVGFGNMPLEEFAFRFGAPVLLVGPEHQDQFRMNQFAAVLDGANTFGFESWRPIPEPDQLQTLPVL